MQIPQSKNFSIGSISERLIKCGISPNYAAAIAGEMKEIEDHCRSQFISKREIDEVLQHHFVRLESKIGILKVEILKWHICTAVVQISGVLSAIAVALEILKN
jgi:hypothetical protein